MTLNKLYHLSTSVIVRIKRDNTGNTPSPMPITRQANKKYFLPSSAKKGTADTREPGVALSSLKARDLKASICSGDKKTEGEGALPRRETAVTGQVS